ncbi:hypothetical protein [Rhodococcus sp. MEB064]|uniref:hypothetical protein n=1 Tax=Rhodococcus sp. MEB064 TaxID=1587522 RepID=UPI0005AD1C34|nr:hypothetical protein [Rhodococcus sp. MEB064]KIQ11796.1 hypothetical protein RU01_18555 [Rhodococcus sp. MEB064]
MSTLIKKLRVDTMVWAVPVGAVIGAILALMLTTVMPKTYTASTVLFIGSPAAGDSAGAYQGDLFSQQRAGTYAQLFSGDDLAVKVNDDLSLGLTPTELASKVTAAAVEKTVLLQLDVVDSSPGRAADIANAYAANFAQFVGQLENPTGGGQPSSLVTVITAAEAPAAPTSPSSTTNLAAGVVLGGALAAGIVWLRRRFDKHVRTPEALAESVGAPVLGILPADSSRSRSMLTLPQDSTDSYTESARKLRTTVQFVDASKQKESLLVAGIGDGSASREVAANLALLLTETGRTVVLVDADLRDPVLHDYVGASPGAGLTDVLTGALMVEDAVVTVADGRLSFLAAGTAGHTPGEDIASNLMRTVLAELARTYDHVVISASDALEFADAAVMSHDVDGTVLVVRRGASTAQDIDAATRAVRSTGGRLYGAVLVDRPGRAGGRPRRVVAASPAPVSTSDHRVNVERDDARRDLYTAAPSVDAAVDRGSSYRDSDADARPDTRRRTDFGDDGQRRDSFRTSDYRQDDHGRQYDVDLSGELDTDPFPVVTASDSDGGWAPAAPVRRHVPARPFPRATLSAPVRVADKSVDEGKPAASVDDAVEGDTVEKAEKADASAENRVVLSKSGTSTSSEPTVEPAPAVGEDSPAEDEDSDAADVSDEAADTTAIAIPHRQPPRRPAGRTAQSQKDASFVASGRVRGRAR